MEALELFESPYNIPRQGQKWHCKNTEFVIECNIADVLKDRVLLISDCGESWVEMRTLKKNFFPVIMGWPSFI